MNKADMKTAHAPVTKWQRPDKSGLTKAPPTYAGLLCREILAENARARAAVDARKKGAKLW